MTAWIITDSALWKAAPEVRQREIRSWLRMNGIAPRDVPADSTVLITDDTAGSVWEIWFEAYRRSEDGRILVDPDDRASAFVEERRVALAVDPPMHWLVPVEEPVPV